VSCSGKVEEDYLEWKDGMREAFATVMGVEEGQGGDTADFAVSELSSHPPEKVYLGQSHVTCTREMFRLTLVSR
jgi:hypothetical protein